MKIEEHFKFLLENLEPRFGLLSKVVTQKILSLDTIENIKTAGAADRQNEQLLAAIKTNGTEEQFLKVLTEDRHNQRHIVNYVNNDGNRIEEFGNCWPLSNSEIETIIANYASLVDSLDCESGLLNHLLSRNVINPKQYEQVQSCPTSTAKNEELLSILRRRSFHDYNETISCLLKTGQEHIAKTLQERAATAEILIRLKPDKADEIIKIKEAEELIMKVMNDNLRPCPSDQNYNANIEVVQRIKYLAEDIKRIGLCNCRVDKSIILSFRCRTLVDLQSVKHELDNEKIKTMILNVYATMGIPSAERMDNVVIKWYKNSYDRCLKFLQDEEDEGLTTGDAGEVIPCEDDLSFALPQTQLRRRLSRIESPKLCYYPSQEHVASLLIKRLEFIFSYYHGGKKLEDFKDFEFRIYTAGSKMLLEQTRRRLCDKNAECLPSNVYGNSDALKYLSKKHVKAYRLTNETKKDLDDLAADAITNPNKLFVIVADEAHFGVSERGQGRELINTWCHDKHPNVVVILVTATPNIFFRERNSSRIPCISVAEKQNDGKFVVVQARDERRNKEVIEVETGTDVSRKVGPVKELHVFRWNECYERGFENGLVVTLRVPQRVLKDGEKQIWLSVEDFSDNTLSPVIGKTDKSCATPLLLRGRNNIVKITNLDESKTLAVMPSRKQATDYEVGFLPTTNVSDERLSLSCFFKVLMNSGEDVLELEVSQENVPLRLLKYTYANSELGLGPPTTEASKLDPSMTYQFLIDSYRSHDEDESDLQYLSFNFYYNSIRNRAQEEQLIRLDKNFEAMVAKFKHTPADHILVSEYAYYIVLLDCIRKATPKTKSLREFISNPKEFWKEYLGHRRSKLETLKLSLENSENSLRPIETSCFSKVVNYAEEKAWKDLQKVCNKLKKRKKDLSQDNIDDLYEALIGYLMHANQESFMSNMDSVKSAVERHMQGLRENADNLKYIFDTEKINVLCRNETFRIVNDLIQTEDEKQEQSTLNGHMKIIRATSTDIANSIYATLTLARKIANDNDDCFFEIIRYFQRFNVSDHETKGPNSRIWQILQPKHCANYTKKPLEPCRCENYDPKDNELECKNCSHIHHSVNTFFDLDRLPCIVIVVEMGRMGDTFPQSLNVMDLRARRPTKPSVPSLIQEVGRICRYQVKSSYSDFPYVLVASKVMNMLTDSLHKSISLLQNANLKSKSEPNCLYNRLLLFGEPQIGKTGVFLKITSHLRKIIKCNNDTFDESQFQKSQLKRTRSSVGSETQTQPKRRKVISESHPLLTTIFELPTDILDTILKKTIIFKLRSTEKLQLKQLLEVCVSQQNEKDEIWTNFAPCNSVWLWRMNSDRFKRALQRYRKQGNLEYIQIDEQICLGKTTSKKNEVLAKQMKAEDAIHCLLCNNIFSNPVKLPCNHVFCLECIQKLKTSTSGNILPCPLCSKDFYTPEESYVDLPKSTFLQKLVEISKKHETSSEENLCDECDLFARADKEQANTKISEAVTYCIVCIQRLCEKCHQHHLIHPVLKSHTLVPLGSLQHKMANIARQMTCDKHPEETANLYCKNCDKTICTKCKFNKQEAHLLHECFLIREAADERRKHLEQDVSSISFMTTKITENHAKLIKELEWHRKTINRCKRQLALSTIETRNLYVKKLEMETYLSVVKHFSLYSQAVQNTGSDVEIIQEFDALKEKAAELKEGHELLSTRPLPAAIDSLTLAELL